MIEEHSNAIALNGLLISNIASTTQIEGAQAMRESLLQGIPSSNAAEFLKMGGKKPFLNPLKRVETRNIPFHDYLARIELALHDRLRGLSVERKQVLLKEIVGELRAENDFHAETITKLEKHAEARARRGLNL